MINQHLAYRTIAMAADINPNGNIFGGWIMSVMDAGVGMFVRKMTMGRVATRAVKDMSFHKSINIGDIVSVYTKIVEYGNTSVTIYTEVFVDNDTGEYSVANGTFIIVGIDDIGNKREIKEYIKKYV